MKERTARPFVMFQALAVLFLFKEIHVSWEFFSTLSDLIIPSYGLVHYLEKPPLPVGYFLLCYCGRVVVCTVLRCGGLVVGMHNIKYHEIYKSVPERYTVWTVCVFVHFTRISLTKLFVNPLGSLFQRAWWLLLTCQVPPLGLSGSACGSDLSGWQDLNSSPSFWRHLLPLCLWLLCFSVTKGKFESVADVGIQEKAEQTNSWMQRWNVPSMLRKTSQGLWMKTTCSLKVRMLTLFLKYSTHTRSATFIQSWSMASYYYSHIFIREWVCC